jgi:hypothetical protein
MRRITPAASLVAHVARTLLIAVVVVACGSAPASSAPGASSAAVPSEAAVPSDAVPAAQGSSAALATPSASVSEITAGMAAPVLPVLGPIAAFDVAGVPAAAGVTALRMLAGQEPGVAVLYEGLSAAEARALDAAIADLATKSGLMAPGVAGIDTDQASGVPVFARLASTGRRDSGVVTAAAEGEVSGESLAAGATFMAGFASGMDSLLTGGIQAGAVVGGTGKDGDSTVSLEIGRQKDGSTVFGMGIESETSKDGVSATTKIGAKVQGQRCPDATGVVAFTVKVTIGADSAGKGITQELTATVTATSGDDARIVGAKIDAVQGARRIGGGRNVYVETGRTLTYAGSAKQGAFSNFREIRVSQDARSSDVDLAVDGLDAATRMGEVILRLSELEWRDGKCVQIEAKEPGKVDPGSTTQIPVEVRHRVDGSSVKSRLEAVLSGGDTITPETLAATPGTLAYKAPGKQNAQATIALTATSRRGIAKLKLAATTGGTDWTADRPAPGGAWKGTKCDGLAGTWALKIDVSQGGSTVHQLFKVTIAAEPDAEAGEGTFTYDENGTTKGNGVSAQAWAKAAGTASVRKQGDGSVVMYLNDTEHSGWGKVTVAGKTIKTPEAKQPLVDWTFPWKPTTCAP